MDKNSGENAHDEKPEESIKDLGNYIWLINFCSWIPFYIKFLDQANYQAQNLIIQSKTEPDFECTMYPFTNWIVMTPLAIYPYIIRILFDIIILLKCKLNFEYYIKRGTIILTLVSVFLDLLRFFDIYDEEHTDFSTD